MQTPLEQLSAVNAAAGIARGDFTAEELVRACLQRIDAREATVRAWTYLDPERALAEARERDAQTAKGPLHGVPIGLKDIIDTGDMPTSYGTEVYVTHRPAADAECVRRLRSAGAVMLGKTVSTEFATYAPGKTCNPHDPGHTPGGSSSGSAAAVADFHVPIALGTQTAGSIIRPAAFNGVIGYKPSYGDFPFKGIRELAVSLDTLGGFARDVADLRLLREVLAGRGSEADSQASGLPRIAFVRTPLWSRGDSAMHDALELLAANLKAAGAVVDDVEIAAEFADMVDAQNALMVVEIATALGPEVDKFGDRLSEQTRELVAQGRALVGRDLSDVRQLHAEWRARLEELLHDYDAIFTPAAIGEAPEGLQSTGDPIFNRIWTFLGLPCVGVPIGVGLKGLPLAAQLVGKLGGDQGLLDVAQWVVRSAQYEIRPLCSEEKSVTRSSHGSKNR